MDMNNIQNEIIIRSIKIIDIGFLTVLYFFLAFFSSVYIDNKLGPFDAKKADKKKIFSLFFEIIIHIWLIGILTYFIRNIIELIPYPLNNINGYNHSMVKELNGGVFFPFLFFLFQRNLQDKLIYIYKRLNL